MEHDHESECCGFGGSFSVRMPDISGAMVQDKTAALKGSGAAEVVSADCGCLLNINGKLACNDCGSERVGAQTERKHSNFWVYFCQQCGKALFFTRK